MHYCYNIWNLSNNLYNFYKYRWQTVTWRQRRNKPCHSKIEFINQWTSPIDQDYIWNPLSSPPQTYSHNFHQKYSLYQNPDPFFTDLQTNFSLSLVSKPHLQKPLPTLINSHRHNNHYTPAKKECTLNKTNATAAAAVKSMHARRGRETASRKKVKRVTLRVTYRDASLTRGDAAAAIAAAAPVISMTGEACRDCRRGATTTTAAVTTVKLLVDIYVYTCFLVRELRECAIFAYF